MGSRHHFFSCRGGPAAAAKRCKGRDDRSNQSDRNSGVQKIGTAGDLVHDRGHRPRQDGEVSLKEPALSATHLLDCGAEGRDAGEVDEDEQEVGVPPAEPFVPGPAGC
jgi:hypothetical protein